MDKPFIHLLRSPLSGYFYDVNRNEIVAVNKDTFQMLCNLVSGKELSDKEQTMYMGLSEMGYLSSKQVEKIEHPLTPLLKTNLERNIGKITLQLTQDCNFRCKYCVYTNNTGNQRSHAPKTMSDEVAKKAIDFLWDHSIDQSRVNVSFYGGEPLIRFEQIKEITAYAEHRFHGKKIIFNLTTNASLLTDEMAQYFMDHDFLIMVSLDGPKEINDKNRVFANGGGTYDTVVRQISHLAERYPEFVRSLSVNMVIDPGNEFDCFNQVAYDIDVLERMNMQSTLVDTTYSNEELSYSDGFIEKSEYNTFLSYLCACGRYPEDQVSVIKQSVVTKTKDAIRDMKESNHLPDVFAPSGPCVPGQMRLFVNVDGEFFPCERVSETSPVMNIGNLDKGFELEKAKAILNIAGITADECKKCWAFRQCTACAKYADDGNGFSKEQRLANCKDIRAYANRLLGNIILYKELLEGKVRE